MKQDILTIGEAARILDVSIPTLRNWDKSGKLKSYRSTGRNIRLYKLSEVNRLVEKLKKIHLTR